MNPITGRAPVSLGAPEGRVRALDLLIALFVFALLLAAAVRQFHTYDKYVRGSPPSSAQESTREAAAPSPPAEQE
jgi:hypothetical protein